jgi:hypothetical protein
LLLPLELTTNAAPTLRLPLRLLGDLAFARQPRQGGRVWRKTERLEVLPGRDLPACILLYRQLGLTQLKLGIAKLLV